MPMQPYLFFCGQCDKAIAVYQKALGAELTMRMLFKENPEPPPPGVIPDGLDAKVMHASMRVGDAEFMLSDGMVVGPTHFSGFSLSLVAKDEAGVDRWFNALAEGGKIEMPLQDMFWGAYFGSLTDRFGLRWMLNCTEAGR